jgi:predicted Zn finger-like uncharacterized protein
MHIICPHCTTSYAIDPATLGTAGRTVRCSRCKEVWLARLEDAIEIAVPAAAMAASGQGSGSADDAAAEWEALAREENAADTPVVDSPSISADWPVDGERSDQSGETDWASMARGEMDEAGTARGGRSWLGRLLPRRRTGGSGKPLVSMPTACAAMGALVLALIIWRADVVRLLPQTAAFYKIAGLEVNLRGLMFKDVKVTSETVEGKPVLVIEGVIVGEGRNTVELPRLRFSVRDAQGAEIYAWNAVLEQPVLKPGERASFKSRLASPPPEGRQIDVRFFNKRDLAAGNV